MKREAKISSIMLVYTHLNAWCQDEKAQYEYFILFIFLLLQHFCYVTSHTTIGMISRTCILNKHFVSKRIH